MILKTPRGHTLINHVDLVYNIYQFQLIEGWSRLYDPEILDHQSTFIEDPCEHDQIQSHVCLDHGTTSLAKIFIYLSLILILKLYFIESVHYSYWKTTNPLWDHRNKVWRDKIIVCPCIKLANENKTRLCPRIFLCILRRNNLIY